MAQAEYLVPTSELQAVNLALESISQVPVVSLSASDTNTDADVALKRLYEANREVQKVGWHFNQEMDFVLDPDGDGKINLPTNALQVYRIYYSGLGGDSKDLVVRGSKLYDRIGHTFVIGCSVKVDLTVLLPFTDLPEAFRWYITIRAVRRFNVGKMHSPVAFQFSSQDEKEAKWEAEQMDAEVDQRTLGGNPHMRRMRRR